MMFIKRLKLYLLLMLIVLLPIISFISYIGRECPKDLRAKSIGIPLCIARENELLYTGIQQIVSDTKYLYVMFNYGVVQVYNLNGEYQQSISVFNHENGRIMIAVHENRLYIRDKINNIYIFQDGVFETFVSTDDSAQILKKINFMASHEKYIIRGSSIWSKNEEGTYEPLVIRPTWLAIYQQNILSISQIILILIICALVFCKSRAK